MDRICSAFSSRDRESIAGLKDDPDVRPFLIAIKDNKENFEVLSDAFNN